MRGRHILCAINTSASGVIGCATVPRSVLSWARRTGYAPVIERRQHLAIMSRNAATVRSGSQGSTSKRGFSDRPSAFASPRDAPMESPVGRRSSIAAETGADPPGTMLMDLWPADGSVSRDRESLTAPAMTSRHLVWTAGRFRWGPVAMPRSTTMGTCPRMGIVPVASTPARPKTSRSRASGTSPRGAGSLPP